MNILFVYITVPDIHTSRSIAETLVNERLCSCANILENVASVYWWDGTVQREKECILIVKTTERHYEALETRVLELHPYEVPCIVALPVSRGFSPFLQWIADETRS